MPTPNPIDEEKRQQSIAMNKEAMKPVLAELVLAGFDVERISDLYYKGFDYRRAIPILLDWLPRVENKSIKEALVRALSVPWARGTQAQKLLVDEFRNQVSDLGLQWAIGNALSVVADDEIVDDVIALIREQQHGKAREMLVVALGNMKKPDVEPFLMELLADPQLVGYAIMALGKLKSQNARSLIEQLQTHPKTWVRKEAQRALRRIEKRKTN